MTKQEIIMELMHISHGVTEHMISEDTALEMVNQLLDKATLNDGDYYEVTHNESKGKFNELIKKEQHLIQRLEEILDKLESPILIIKEKTI